MGAVLSSCRTKQGEGEPGEMPNGDHTQAEPNRQRKRFNPFFMANQQTEMEVQLQEKYKFVSNYEDRFMGRCTVMEELESGNLYLCRDIEFKTDAACREAVERLKNKKVNQEHYENVLRIVEVYGKRVDGLLKDQNKATILMEYPLVSIKRQFNNRLLNKVDFEIHEIKAFIFATIKAYHSLERAGCTNDKVRLAHIFMGLQLKESIIKVIDSQLLLAASNFQSMRNGGNNSAQNHDVYLAPEEFQALVSGQKQPPQELRNKAAVFSLGASILDLCNMSSCYDFYHYTRQEINREQIRGFINIARKRHGALVYKLLTSMLEFDPHKRPSFADLEVIIAKPLSASELSGANMRLSTVKDEHSKYLVGTRHSGRYGKVSDASRMSQSISERMFCRGGEAVQEEEQEQLIQMHEQYTNGSQYIGQKKHDLKHGRGKYIFKDRSYYEGWWRDDMMHGEGQLFFPNGKVEYQGEWAFDEPNGWGVLRPRPDPSVAVGWTRYEGEMKNGEMHGRGKAYFTDNAIFEGEFQNGKVFGRGCRISPDGQIVQREWALMSLQEVFDYNQPGLAVSVREEEQGGRHF